MADQAFGAQAFGANKWGGIQLFVFDDTGADYAATGTLLLAGGPSLEGAAAFDGISTMIFAGAIKWGDIANQYDGIGSFVVGGDIAWDSQEIPETTWTKITVG